jgi:hypothetical protein
MMLKFFFTSCWNRYDSRFLSCTLLMKHWCMVGLVISICCLSNSISLLSPVLTTAIRPFLLHIQSSILLFFAEFRLWKAISLFSPEERKKHYSLQAIPWPQRHSERTTFLDLFLITNSLSFAVLLLSNPNLRVVVACYGDRAGCN